MIKESAVIVTLTEDYRLEIDEWNYKLQRRRVGDDPKKKTYKQDIWNTLGYYSSPGGVLLAAVNHAAVSTHDILSLQQFMDRQEHWANKFHHRYLAAVAAKESKKMVAATSKPKHEVSTLEEVADNIKRPLPSSSNKKKKKKRNPKRV